MTKQTTIKVTPGSRGNFNKLRRFQSGGEIPKYQLSTTAGGVQYIDNSKLASSISYKEGTSWRSHVYEQFQEKLFELLRAATTREQKQQVVNAINDMQQSYADLVHKYPNLGPTQFDQVVQQYQQDIITKYPFVNTLGINYGLLADSQRYIKPRGANTGDRGGGDGTTWTTDGRFSGMTADRTLLGRNGQHGDKFAKLQKDLRSMGYDIGLLNDPNRSWDDAYRLSLWNEPEDNKDRLPEEEGDKITPKGTGTTSIKGGSTGTTRLPTPYNILEKEQKTTPNSWTGRFRTDPLFQAALRGNTGITNRRILDHALQQKVPLQHTAEKAYNRMGDYTYQTAMQKQMGENDSMGARLMGSTSDLTQGLQAALAAHAYNNKLATDAALHQDAKNEQEMNKAVETENYNKAVRANDANVNREALVGLHNMKLNEKAKFAANEGQANEQWLTANRQSYVQNNMDDQLNDYKRWKNTIDYGTDGKGGYYGAIQKLQKSITDAKDIHNYDPYKRMFDSRGNLIINYGRGDVDPDGRFYGITKWKNFGDGDRIIISQQDFDDYLTTEQGAKEFKDLIASHTKYVNDVYDNAEDQKTALTNQYQYILENNTPVKFSGELPSYYTSNRPSWSFSYKQGGSVSYKESKKDRFLDYLEHNRKATKDFNDRIVKVEERSQKLLQRGLDALDRETLLLLRSIFK